MSTIGFTGGRAVSMADLPRIGRIVMDLPDTVERVITGACVGVDATVARVAHRRGLHVHAVVPANRSQVDPRWREFCTTFEEMPPGATYRDRNHRIVDLSDDIIAIPSHAEHAPESRRSGTWMTVRIARRAGKPVVTHVLADRAAQAAEGRGG